MLLQAKHPQELALKQVCDMTCFVSCDVTFFLGKEAKGRSSAEQHVDNQYRYRISPSLLQPQPQQPMNKISPIIASFFALATSTCRFFIYSQVLN
jgi:hypothetical protein